MLQTNDVSKADEIRRQMLKDPHRPAYHFQPPANWMNDPNGFIHWKGQYHLFYQHHPYGPLHANMHWGHAVSDDLVHWQDLPIALTPDPDGPDSGGCWSGCAVDNEGVPTLLYTGVWPESQCIAVGTDDLIDWVKHENNPVIAAPPPGLEVTGFRDPCVWREGDTWYMVIGSGIQDVGGTILLYRSPDLINWEYIHPALIGDKDETALMWECPGFFALGDKHILIISVYHLAYVEYFIGTYKDYKFEPEHHARLDHSGLFYAPQTTLDASGRRLMFGWVRESRSDALVEAAGWSGMQSLPRVLSLGPDDRLHIEPAKEIQDLRGEHHRLAGQNLTPDSRDMLPEIKSNCLEIIAEFERGTAGEFGLKVCCSPGGEEQTLIVYRPADQTLTIDRTQSCVLSDGVDKSPQSGVVALDDGEPLILHIFLDRSIIEIFANGRECLTSRIYPTRDDSLGIDLFAHSGDVALKRMDVWEMASIWE